MPEPLTPRDLPPALSSVGADTDTVRAMLRETRQRAEEQARERLESLVLGKSPPSDRTSIAAPQPSPRLSPDRPVEIRLQNGRKVRARLTSAVAQRRDLAALGRVSAANDRRALIAIERQRQALELLRRSHEELSKKVTALQERSDRTLMTLLQELAGVNEGLRVVQVQEQTIRAQRLSVQRLAIRQQRQLRALATTSRLQQVTGIVNSIQGSAYGEKGSILATNNLLLAANQLLWMFLDPVLRSVGIIEGSAPSLAVWLAPLGSLVTGQLVLGNRQHVRFISGVATFVNKGVVSVSLRDRIADDLWPDFQRRTDVPVTVAPLDRVPGRDPIASVENGVLRIEIPIGLLLAGVTIRVAWMVDTGADGG